MVATLESLTLEEFLQLPETKPATEFINGQTSQKPMPQGKHSRLQLKLCNVIAPVVEEPKIAGVFPELRCTFGGASIVPDIVIIRWDRIPREASGQVANRFNLHPDWSIEILSPDQNLTKVLGNLLHCSQNGTELGWLLNPAEESILIVMPEQRVQLLTGAQLLPVIAGLSLELTVEQVFGWLTL